MFRKIFFFEIRYKLKRPAVYLYFLLCFFFTFMTFAVGALPLDEKQWINGTSSIEFFISIMSMMMMLVSSSLMGIPLYRDIEYNTKEYYLSYPITKADYFWGRYLSSFLFVLLINAAILPAAWLGSIAGPAFGWEIAAHYGPNHFTNYLYPYLTLAVPNLFFTASLFFGLVAITKNVKVIYSSGILLFLGYMIANFFIGSSSSKAVIYLSDPFAVNAVRFEKGLKTLAEKNNMLTPIKGYLLANRIIWTAVGVIILLYTYISFSFEKFFSNGRGKKATDNQSQSKPALPPLNINFKQGYNIRTLFTLTRIEILNIIRDNYFWIIIAGGSIFLGIVFSHGPGNYWVRDYPRTSMILFIFNDAFMIFIFCIIAFYTGETIHREKATRYAFINDALPPSDWIFNIAKFLSICCLALFLSLIPMIIGITVQLSMGYHQLNIPLYLSVLLGTTLPKCIEMAMFAFMLHICINNKFAALGVAISLWVLFTIADKSGWMNYHLLLYAFTPFYAISDIDGVGHMFKAVSWFNLYWLLFGGLLLMSGYLFYVRGTITSYKERLQLAKERFRGNALFITVIISVLFIAVAVYNYYNVSYINHYYTDEEYKEHAAILEKKLKHYEDMSLPSVTNIKLYADLYPSKRSAIFKAYVTLVNKTKGPINTLLLDGDNVADFSIRNNNITLPYTSPVIFRRGKFNLFGPANDTSAYRLYQLPRPLATGDSTIVEVNSYVDYKGFRNSLYGVDLLYNGTFTGLGLPGLGYDEDEELWRDDDRKKYGLPKKEDEFAESKEEEGNNKLLEGAGNLIGFDITVSTDSNETAVAPGNLVKQWKENGRNYYHYAYEHPGVYNSLALLSAKYATLQDSIILSDGSAKNINLYYYKPHHFNLDNFMAAYKDGLRYYAQAFGALPVKQISLAEATIYGPQEYSAVGLNVYNERNAWNADLINPNDIDYCYFTTTKQLAEQWWGIQVAPNHTKGSRIISVGLPTYASLVMAEKKYGKENMRKILEGQLNFYLWGRGRYATDQSPLLKTNRWNEFESKAAIVLYGLKDLIGEDSLNLALREFRDAFAYRNSPPFAGSKELYGFIKKHVPDSLQYYLTDTWEKISFYDNSVTEIKSQQIGKSNQYKVSLKLNIAKVYEDNNGKEMPAKDMNDYIDVAIFGKNTSAGNGRTLVNQLFIKKYKLSYGEHTLDIIVKGKPVSAGVDPYLKLIDRAPQDNIKNL